MNRWILPILIAGLGFLVLAASGAADVPCEVLIEQGQKLLDQRPVGFGPGTAEAARAEELKRQALETWTRARSVCRAAARTARDRVDAARFASLQYSAHGASLELEGRVAEAYETYAAGIEEVEALDRANSEHLIALYRRSALCAGTFQTDAEEMVRSFERVREIAETLPTSDSRRVTALLDLATAYQVQAEEPSPPREPTDHAARIEALYQAAVELARCQSTSTSDELASRVVDEYCGWLIQQGRADECAAIERLECSRESTAEM